MGTFAEMFDEAMKRKGWGYNRLSVEIGVLPSGGIFNPTQIRRLRLGERKHMSHELLARLIDVLDLDPAEAWAAAGLLPPGTTADHLRKLDLVATGARVVSPGKRPLGTDRRRGDRRRLHLVPPVAA
jgi:hypothetical protein